MGNIAQLSLFFVCSFLFAHSFFAVESFNVVDEEDINRSHFPDGFLFGTSTSAYQIEGGYLEDGKSLNNWDVFTHALGGNRSENTGDIADDHYNRYLEDTEMMHDLGVNSYRLSISWARILPKGRFGKVNQRGVKFYNKLFDSLLHKGIEPFVTMHHYDFPQVLEDKYGSWLNSSMQKEFVHFAKICFKNFGDRVKYWSTFNEPNLFTIFAYKNGAYPPSRCSKPFGNCFAGNSETEPFIAMHNMLLAHGRAAKLYRKQFEPTQKGSIGIVLATPMYEPLTNNKRDIKAADMALASVVAWAIDPLVFGSYPSKLRRVKGDKLPKFSAKEVKIVKGSIDFIGLNHYTTFYAKDCSNSTCGIGSDGGISTNAEILVKRNGVLIGDPTGLGFFYVVPRGMEKIIGYVKDRYNNMPMFVTENGYALPPEEDQLHDTKRIQFHKAYLASLARAISNGANVRGYFIWSLMDCYEWALGYDSKFGLHYVDRQTLERIPKLSAKWYKNFLSHTKRSSMNK